MSTNEITAKVRELKELKTMMEELAGEISTLEDAIKAEMLKKDTEELSAGIYKVRYTKVQSKRFDTTAFKKEHSALYEQYAKQTENRRFSIV